MAAYSYRFVISAASMFLGGWLGLMLTIPPDYASPLWPPSGIALAALLLGGKNLWPSVWLGAFMINYSLGIGITGQTSLPVMLPPLVIGLASSLQTSTAVWLSEKLLGHKGVPNLDNLHQVFAFFLLTGPVACLIAPSIGTLFLTTFDLMPNSDWQMSWWRWWFGDSFGVLLVTPLVFCLLAKPRPRWRPGLLRIALPVLAALLIFFISFSFVFRAEQNRIQLAFDNQAAIIDSLLVKSIEHVMDSTLALKDLYQASDIVHREDFALFARSLLKRHPDIKALEWLPRINQQALLRFEQNVRAEGFKDFSVTEITTDGHLQNATPRDEYFPILFVEPMAGNEAAFGFDSLSSPLSRKSKEWARHHAKPSISEKLLLVQHHSPETGVLISIPVYAPSTALAAADNLEGFVSSVLLPTRMVQTSLQDIDNRLFAIRLIDLNATADNKLLFEKTVPQEVTEGYGLKRWEHDVQIFDRTWRLVINADSHFIAEQGSMLPQATLLGGLCFASLLTLLLLTVTGQTALAEALVDARTQELQVANRHLKASENKLRTLIASQPECVKLLARDGSLLEMNQAGLQLIEANDLAQVLGSNVSKIVLPQYRSAFVDMTRKVFSGESVSLEFEIQTLKGRQRWLNTHAVPFRDNEGHIIALLGMTRDITTQKNFERELQKNEKKLNNILDNLMAYVYLKDQEGRYLYANRLVRELWGTSLEQIIGFSDEDFFDIESTHKIRENDRRVLIEGETLAGEETNLSPKTGKRMTFWSVKEPLRNEQGEIYALLGVSTDITERKKTEDNLRLAARVFGEAHEGILITNAQGTIIDVNPTFCDITGYNRAEIIGQNPKILQSGKHDAKFYQAMWSSLLENRHWQGEVWNRTKQGNLYAELLTISALRNDQGEITHYLGLFSDITQSKQQQQMLELMAHYDPLTHLPNRVLLADRLQQAIAHSKREGMLLAICFLDLDSFKPVNDQLGHETGDHLLIEVAERIRHCIREQDSVSRHGGDEFTLLLNDLHTVEEAEQAVARIHQAIIRPYSIQGQSVTIGVSSGITLYPLDDAPPDVLLRHADHAMYQAKLAGKNRYKVFDPNQDQQVINRHKQLHDIEAAFEDGQFQLYYQPKVDMRNGRVVGVEALIRWIHPERGLIPPIAFLPIIASTELEIRVGNWVMEQAWHQLSLWHQQGLLLGVSVNISAFHLVWSDFHQHLSSVLKQSPQTASHYLQLEILESTALEDLSAVNQVIKLCRDTLGVTTSLDDFGTGYSSLAHLRHLPVNTVKIDKSFVYDMLDDPDDYAIVDGIIGLSQAFGREVIAEGVESDDQGSVLLLLGCHLAQGYAIAKPMPAGQLAAWIQQFQPPADWLHYAESAMSDSQILITIHRICLKHWLQRLSLCLDATPDQTPTGPMMEASRTHFGRWLKHSQLQDGTAPSEDRQPMALLYKQMLQQANQLMGQLRNAETASAHNSFVRIQTLQKQLDHHLSEQR